MKHPLLLSKNIQPKKTPYDKIWGFSLLGIALLALLPSPEDEVNKLIDAPRDNERLPDAYQATEGRSQSLDIAPNPVSKNEALSRIEKYMKPLKALALEENIKKYTNEKGEMISNLTKTELNCIPHLVFKQLAMEDFKVTSSLSKRTDIQSVILSLKLLFSYLDVLNSYVLSGLAAEDTIDKAKYIDPTQLRSAFEFADKEWTRYISSNTHLIFNVSRHFYTQGSHTFIGRETDGREEGLIFGFANNYDALLKFSNKLAEDNETLKKIEESPDGLTGAMTEEESFLKKEVTHYKAMLSQPDYDSARMVMRNLINKLKDYIGNFEHGLHHYYSDLMPNDSSIELNKVSWVLSKNKLVINLMDELRAAEEADKKREKEKSRGALVKVTEALKAEGLPEERIERFISAMEQKEAGVGKPIDFLPVNLNLKWFLLDTSNAKRKERCDFEAAAMGHCATDSRGSLLSLRELVAGYWLPIVTVTIRGSMSASSMRLSSEQSSLSEPRENQTDKKGIYTITQLKTWNNNDLLTKEEGYPTEAAQEGVAALLMDNRIAGIAAGNDFDFSHLTLEQRNSIYEAKPFVAPASYALTKLSKKEFLELFVDTIKSKNLNFAKYKTINVPNIKIEGDSVSIFKEPLQDFMGALAEAGSKSLENQINEALRLINDDTYYQTTSSAERSHGHILADVNQYYDSSKRFLEPWLIKYFDLFKQEWLAPFAQEKVWRKYDLIKKLSEESDGMTDELIESYDQAYQDSEQETYERAIVLSAQNIMTDLEFETSYSDTDSPFHVVKDGKYKFSLTTTYDSLFKYIKGFVDDFSTEKSLSEVFNEVFNLSEMLYKISTPRYLANAISDQNGDWYFDIEEIFRDKLKESIEYRLSVVAKERRKEGFKKQRAVKKTMAEKLKAIASHKYEPKKRGPVSKSLFKKKALNKKNKKKFVWYEKLYDVEDKNLKPSEFGSKKLKKVKRNPTKNKYDYSKIEELITEGKSYSEIGRILNIPRFIISEYAIKVLKIRKNRDNPINYEVIKNMIEKGDKNYAEIGKELNITPSLISSYARKILKIDASNRNNVYDYSMVEGLYKEGNSIKEISKKLNISVYSIRRYLIKKGYTLKNFYDYSQVEDLIKQGYKYDEISKILNIDSTAISNYAVKKLNKRVHNKVDLPISVIQEYNTRGNLKSVAEIYGVRLAKLSNFLKAHGVSVRDMGPKIYLDEKKIIEMYYAKYTLKEIAEEFNVSEAPIIRILSENKIKVKLSQFREDKLNKYRLAELAEKKKNKKEKG